MTSLPLAGRPSSPLPAPDLAVDPEAIRARLEDHAREAAGAFAPNTVRALAADSRVFSAWCAGQGRDALPAAPETVAAFVDAMAEVKAPATVRRYCASIASMHRAAGLAPPTATQPVKLALRRMARAKGGRQRQAEPLNRPTLDRMLAAAGQGGEPTAIALRDAALAAVAYDTLLRRSELVSLYIEDLAPASDEGATILVRKSKTDQGGEGTVKFLALDTARAVRAYLDAIGAPTKGPLFRPVTRWGRAGETALESQEVPRLFRKLASAAGVRTPRPHSGHSTRVGAAQDMLAAGLELGEVMQAGSWKTVAMVARYGERLLARRGAARKLAVLQNRA
ncbi:tyrosine-type recombinase/integrase [Lichenibacterium dinghuense]|uniref:tyrosine-type recombinase/integrase n=1 Tax=Lichenibacterium dinghuense TaxID=2895977 RepID=UPI001F01D593|nr:tyrosine-type recombinase/integrase [Lichenibacterium sp. 6Y81]